MSFLSQRLSEKILRLECTQSAENHVLNDFQMCSELTAFSIKTGIRNLFATKLQHGCLNIAFAVSGGIGDQVIELQWVKSFLEWIKQSDVRTYVVLCFPNPALGRRLAKEFPFIDRIEDLRFCKNHKFDLLLSVDYCVRFWSYDRKSVCKFAPTLVESFDAAYKRSLTYIEFDQYQYHYQLMHICLAKGLTRYELLGEVGLGVLDRHTKPFFFVDNKQVEDTLAKFGLLDKPFITLQSGVGGIPLDGLAKGVDPNKARQHATKTMPKSLAEDVIVRLKEDLPQFTLVQIGEPDGIRFEGVDLCLIGQSSLEDSFDLLSAAQVHIGNDSGLVHIRHAMGKRSVVVWGPTAKDFLGYPEDENLQGDCLPCMWLTSDWNLNCPRGYDHAKCMGSILAGDVVAAVKRLV